MLVAPDQVGHFCIRNSPNSDRKMSVTGHAVKQAQTGTYMINLKTKIVYIDSCFILYRSLFHTRKKCFLSGLLIAKKRLFRNPVPGGCGGGTVLFVS